MSEERAMRLPRLKPDYQDSWHHCYNRTAGTRLDRPFDDADKEALVRILRKVSELYTVRVVSYQIMSNHFHLLLHTPAALPTPEETCQRFEAFHRGKRTLEPNSPRCGQWRERLRDVSWFMRHLQHLFTCWYNRTRPVRRRGSLWAGRFKNTLLGCGVAVWGCWVYVERNSVRAGMVPDPADYRFCSYRAWVQGRRHPFEDNARMLLVPVLGPVLQVEDLAGLQQELRKEFARLAAEEAQRSPQEVAAAIAAAEAPVAFTLSAQRRVRHWVDGLVIGSEIFVRDVMSRVQPKAAVARHRLAHATAPIPGAVPVCCWRRLRVMTT